MAFFCRANDKSETQIRNAKKTLEDDVESLDGESPSATKKEATD
jgi:hypothetical protein